MLEWNNPFKKHDLRERFRFWLKQEVQNLEDLRGVTGRLSIREQSRLEILKQMNQRMAYGGERSAFSRLDTLSQIEINGRFPGLFDDPTPPWKPAMPELKPWDPLDTKPSPPPWKPGIPEPKPWDPLDVKPFPPWRPGGPERKPWDPPDPESFLPPWRK